MAKKELVKFNVTFTDTFGESPNFSWVERFQVEAETIKKAITKAKQHRYYSPLPRHTMNWDTGDEVRIDIKGSCVCAFIEYAHNNELDVLFQKD